MSQQLLNPAPEYMENSGLDVVAQLEAKIDDLESRISGIEAERPEIQRAAVVIVLQLLTDALRHVASGKMDLPNISQISSSVPTAPQFDPRWEAWKQKLGGTTAPARVISALLTHGSLNRTQLRSVGELGWSTLDAATKQLRGLNLIEKIGDKWQLKQL